MKILFLSSLYPPHTKGGGELSTHYIAQALQARGHNILVITSGQKREEVTVEGVPVLRLPMPLTAKPLFEQRLTKKIASALEKEINGYDVVHAHDFRTTMALAELLPSSEGRLGGVFATARDYAHICGSPNNLLADGSICPGCNWQTVWKNMGVVEAPAIRKPFRAWQYVYNISYRRSTWQTIPNHIFISHAQQGEFKKQGISNPIHGQVIYNPVPAAYLTESVKPGITGNVLFVGTLNTYKGVDQLLETWGHVATQEPHARLKIIGDGPKRAAYERWVERAGLQYCVSFVGRVPANRMLRIYDEASIIVSPHLWVEPFGRTVAEGLARGKIVVAANIGGPAEIIKDNTTGLLFEHASQPALRQRLLDALRLPDARRQMVSWAAQKWARHNVSPDIIVAAHEQYYQAQAVA